MSNVPACCPYALAARRYGFLVAAASALAAAVFAVRSSADDAPSKAEGPRLFEMRTYIAPEGKLESLHKRFRDHTTKLFEKHGMTNIGYWTPTEGDAAKNTLVYILAYPSKEAKDASWKAFISDPVWKKAQMESEKDGKLVEKVTSVILTPTDYSEIK